MVMIPTDVGVQVRSQTESPLHPLRPVAEISADLPDLQKGQVFRAHIQEALPENTFKALVAGRLLTLSLPEGAKTGDTLDLVVIDRTPRAIVARMAEGSPAAAGEPYQHATLSRTGQLIASLLAREGESAMPATLNRGRSLLPQMPANAAALVQGLLPRLAQAVSTSGLFYEAHQVQWALGQRPLATLLTEPQGRHSGAATLVAFGQPGTAQESAAKSALAARREAAPAPPPPVSLLQTLFGGETATAGAVAAESRLAANPAAVALAIPDDLRPLVQQQLEAAATQRLAWHGEIWPEQSLGWEIERDARQGDGAPDDAAWATNLRLTLPRLGAIDVRLRLNGQNVQLVLHTLEASAVTDLDAAIPSLRQALAATGLTLLEVRTQHDAR